MSNKLHLGCGKRYLEGYIHVDVDKYDHIDYVSNINKLNMFPNEFATLIYASHCIEYFDRVEIIEVLKEWKRVLLPGGILRVAVPDFEALIKVYGIGNDLKNVLGPLYGRWSIGENKFIYHKTVYDLNSLTTLLEDAGFIQIQKWNWREVFKNHKNFDDHSQAYFPHMDKENGLLVSLNIQCTKP